MHIKHYLILAIIALSILPTTNVFAQHPNEISEEKMQKERDARAAGKAARLAKKRKRSDPTEQYTAKPVKRATELGTCTELGKFIESCKPYKCRMPHPQANNFMIDHEVAGFVTDDLLCNHTQTIPGNGIIDCKYPRDMRKVIAKQFNGTGDIAPEDAHIVSAYFDLFCRVIK